MTLLELAELVADLIKKHGPNIEVCIYDKVNGWYTYLDGTYGVHNTVNPDPQAGPTNVIKRLITLRGE